MGQCEALSEWLSPAKQAIRMPVAWRYMLGDGKWRWQREWSDGANMHPAHETTAEDSGLGGAKSTANNNAPVKIDVITLRNPYLSR